MTQYPELDELVRQADAYLKAHIFPKENLSIDNKVILLSRIRESLEFKKRKTKSVHLWIRYAGAACIFFAINMLLYYFMENQASSEIIVINQSQNIRDIQLITADKTASFSENVDLEISQDGIVRIHNQPGEEEELKVQGNTQNKLIVPFGKRSKIELPDGTQVWLNSGSTLEFPSNFAHDRRDITITGEMYADVVPDKNRPFFVHTSNFDLQVYGTKFNISVYDHRIQTVVLKEGSVGLNIDNSSPPYKLSPNEMAIFDQEGFSKKKHIDVLKHISWIDGYIILDDTPVIEILQYIDDYYDISLDFSKAEKIKNHICNGKLYLSENLNNVLKAIALLSNLEYSETNHTLYMKE